MRPCVPFKIDKETACAVYGDDFFFVDSADVLDEVEAEMRERYKLKVIVRLGPDPNDDKETTILNRVVRWIDEEIKYEADPRKDEKIISELGFEDAKSVATSCITVSNE